ncbi:holo-ACP synthase [Gammaproteobacteria bacterium 54_18_T64]|nr:holo-ACP synthase [Gammaproteobacteria bacterium 54_18_T64]
MIVGIGSDLVHISRIEAVLERRGEAFAKRILRPEELLSFTQKNTARSQAAFLAKRFAAKEAVSKALKTGIGEVSWQHILVSNTASGAPEITLSDNALLACRALGAETIHLSLSDEQDMALAFVVLSA